ncbi:TatD family hydrolase [Anaerofustis stercorihominis]|uniref:TatD family deoxyribonuclease n=1 Tax=Anaerofustis stercorihominis TaxID=214853 RepID=A0A3E3DW63_9FIRM|nr:TatD family hydrolase [Anaerofustis stercorihominis]RGD73537.1 TatD family deoxyribonuclease [Anaerofustis stercorihominis]
MLFDTHAHLNDEEFNEDLDDIIKELKEKHFDGVVNIGYDYESSLKAVELSKKEDFFYASVGLHPHDSKDYNKILENEFIKLVKENEKVVAYGEIGLDYYYDNSPRDTQKEVFIRQLKVASELNKPVIIHSRDAAGDTYDILKAHLNGNTGIIHSCSASAEMVREYVKLGMYISFSGSVTFKNANNVREAAKAAPLDKLLIETDCPYLTPVPFRGKRNKPPYVEYTARMLAEVKGISYEEIIEITDKNAREIFKIK